jgi:citrate lyase subunit beta/citryl-CoA lyase
MPGDATIHEARRTMALPVSGNGRAAGMQRGDVWSPPRD